MGCSMERKLSVILAADVVGYSTLMEEDEEGTFDRLRAGRKELFEPEIAKRHGHIFKLIGDGLLAEFASVVDAVECAVALQRGLADRNADEPEHHRILVRIGINFGEVIVEGDDRYGEGVNIAARLQQLADPGGICVSGKVAREVERKLAFGFASMGEQQVKNLAEPVSVYRVVLDAPLLDRMPAPPPLPRKPSIAVLPFENMSGDPEQEYFADGVVEEIITALSRLRWLFVIARNSSFAYKGKAVDIRQVARELGVGYVLEGSIRKSGSRLRLTGQLVDGSTGAHVWADKFEGALEDVFDLQDRMTESVVGVIEPSIRLAEIERARQKRPDKLDAYDLFLHALPHTVANTPADVDQALLLLDEALHLDPDYAVAHAYAAWCHQQRFRDGLMPDDRSAVLRHAEAAIRTGTDDPQALSIAAFAQAHITHDFTGSIALLDQALAMNGNSAITLRFSSIMHAFDGQYDRAIELAMMALRLSPMDPMNYHPYLALTVACYSTDRFADAARYATSAIQANPVFSLLHVFLVASNVKLGRLDLARAAAQRLIEIAPAFTIGNFERIGYIPRPLVDQVAGALRIAGLPDGAPPAA
jgi:adenylate cyclase